MTAYAHLEFTNELLNGYKKLRIQAKQKGGENVRCQQTREEKELINRILALGLSN